MRVISCLSRTTNVSYMEHGRKQLEECAPHILPFMTFHGHKGDFTATKTVCGGPTQSQENTESAAVAHGQHGQTIHLPSVIINSKLT